MLNKSKTIVAIIIILGSTVQTLIMMTTG